MKKVLLLLIIFTLSLFSVPAYEMKSSHSEITLDLDIEKVVVGFSSSESEARNFNADKSEFEVFSDASSIKDEGRMYFFYDAALFKGKVYSLSAKINGPLVLQNAEDTDKESVGEGEREEDYRIEYKADILNNVSYEDFKAGTWVTGNESVTIASTDSNASLVLSTLRGVEVASPTLVYASAFEIVLSVTESELREKKAGVYRSSITFAVTAN